MKYMLMFADDRDGSPTEEQMAAVMTKVEHWWEEHSHGGEIVGGERLQPASRATTVRFSAGAPAVIDGPFAETKESIGGFAIVDVPDLDRALALAKSWPASAAVEIRPLWVD
ncbi:MAG: YciI family protein [Candidatus Dormibacteria bacterium]